MRRRHEALKKVHDLLLEKSVSVEQVFDDKTTLHADLDLSWVRPEIQEKIGPKEEYDVVMATVRPGQISNAHLHEVGASSFIVLGPKVGLPEPTHLKYRIGEFVFPTGEVLITKETLCHEGLELDIPSYQVHQFENMGSEPAHIIIIAHPIICTKKGDEDIHFVMTK